MSKTINGHLRTLCLVGLALLSANALHASISVTLSPSPAGPQPVGTIITWTATVQDTAAGGAPISVLAWVRQSWPVGDRARLQPA